MTRTVAVAVGLILSALLALGDLSDIFQPDNPEPGVMIAAGAVLGVLTLIGAVLAWRGSQSGATVVIVTRLLSAAGAFESFFVHGFANHDRVATVVAAGVTALAVTLIAVPARRTSSGTASQPLRAR